MDTVTAISSGLIWFISAFLCLFIGLWFYRQELKGRFNPPLPPVANAVNTSTAQIPSPSTTHISETKEVQAQSLEDRVYTTWTLHQIFESMQDEQLTSLQIGNMVRPHVTKWIRINEQISNVLEHPDSISITISEKDRVRIIYLSFEKTRWKSRLETLRPGDRLLAEGRITEITQYTMDIDDCKVLDIKPKESSLSKDESKDTKAERDKPNEGMSN